MAKYIVCTDHVFPPIPIRTFDWAAWFDGHEESVQGSGPTEEAAILDLFGNYDFEEYQSSPEKLGPMVIVMENQDGTVSLLNDLKMITGTVRVLRPDDKVVPARV